MTGNRGNLSPLEKAPSLCGPQGAENISALARLGKTPFPPLVPNFQLGSSDPCGLPLGNSNNAMSRKKQLIPQILGGQHPRDLLNNFNSFPGFSPFASFGSSYGSPQSNPNNMFGFSPYGRPNFLAGFGPGASSSHNSPSEAFAKTSAFTNILRGLGTMTYNGKFSYNSQAVSGFNHFNPANVDLSSPTNEK